MIEARIKEAIRKIASTDWVIVRGEVQSVQDDTVQVQFPGGLVVEDVQLLSRRGTDNYMIIRPKPGSQVTCIGDRHYDNLFVIAVDETDEVEYKYGDMLVRISGPDQKVKVENGTTSLKEILDELVSIIEGLKVYTPVGPSGTPLPDTISRLQLLSQKINQILE
jgi:hypothetical protein